MAKPEALPADFFYDAQNFARELAVEELPQSFAPLHHSFAFESTKRNNLHYLDEDNTLVYSAGSIVHFLDLQTNTQSYLQTPSGNDIGALVVLATDERTIITVCERGVNPNVLMYEYPSLRLHRVLRKGTERAYSTACFSTDGKKLATVGSYPDYMLTVWDWQAEAIILRCKVRQQPTRLCGPATFSRARAVLSAMRQIVTPHQGAPPLLKQVDP